MVVLIIAVGISVVCSYLMLLALLVGGDES